MPHHEALSDYPNVISFPVRWGDMDAYQHVNNVVYFQYFESARIAYFSATGVTVDSGLPGGPGPILASTSCRFRAPVTYPDTLHAGARVDWLGEDRFQMSFALFSEQLDRVAAEGTGLIVSYDYGENQKVVLPQDWVDAIEKLEGREIERRSR